jgi:DNA-binding SARP family transcriptional activator
MQDDSRTTENRPRITVQPFGEVRIIRDGVPIPIQAGNNRKLLACLAVNVGDKVSRETLCEAFWPDSDPEKTRNRLRSTLGELKQAIGPEILGAS